MDTTFEQRLAAVQRRAEMSHIGADSIDMTDLVTVEVRGDVDDTHVWTAELVLTRAKAGYAIWALAKSIGLDEEAEAMLTAAHIEGWGT